MRWGDAAGYAELHRLINKGQIDPNNISADYLGDVVSGTFFREYKPPPPGGRNTAIRRFRKVFRKIQLDRELTGQQLGPQGKWIVSLDSFSNMFSHPVLFL